jgi:hypothetical protein
MAKPNFTQLAGAAAWGDLSEVSEPAIGNLYAISIRLPSAVRALFKLGGSVLSMLASAVTLPDETIETDTVPTRLSDFDIAVGKKRGKLTVTFNEQVGVPVIQILYAWHKSIVDARGGGIGFPEDYKSEVWVAPLTGDGTPYYWHGFRRTFPLMRGKLDFGFDDRKHKKVGPIDFSYLEYVDIAEAAAAEGGNLTSNLLGVAKKAAV